MNSLLNWPQQWINVTYTYIRFIVSLFCCNMPNCHSLIAGIGWISLAIKVLPTLLANPNLAYPHHTPSPLPPFNSVCFAHIKLLFHNLGMCILQSLKQSLLPSVPCCFSFLLFNSIKSQLLLRLLQEDSPHYSHPMDIFLWKCYLNGNLWLFISHHHVLLSPY